MFHAQRPSNNTIGNLNISWFHMVVYGTYVYSYLVLIEIIDLSHKIQYPKIMVFHTFLLCYGGTSILTWWWIYEGYSSPSLQPQEMQMTMYWYKMHHNILIFALSVILHLPRWKPIAAFKRFAPPHLCLSIHAFY